MKKRRLSLNFVIIAILFICACMFFSIFNIPNNKDSIPSDTSIASDITTSSPNSDNEANPNSNASETIEPVSPYSFAKVIGNSVNLRAGPGTNYKIIGNTKFNDELSVFYRNEESTWLQIKVDEPTWISADLVKLTYDINSVPVAPSISFANESIPELTTTFTAPANFGDCTLENSLIWHAVSEMLLDMYQNDLKLWDNSGIGFYELSERAKGYAQASSNIPHPECLDTLDENLGDVLYNYWHACNAMAETDIPKADESLYWTKIFMEDFYSEYARLSTRYGWSRKMVNEWKGVKIGMCSDDVLKLHPKSETIGEPDNLGDTTIGLLVKWNYSDSYLIFARWSVGGVSCYRVRQIYLRD